jgi:solute:Na+ symporter, SSS family
MAYATLAALGAALLLFVWVGLRARSPHGDIDQYLTARHTQSATTLGLSFLASGMGAWILFAPPEVGAFVGPVALAGYALGSALPFLVLAWCGPAIRERLPQGRSISEYAQQRFGAGLKHWVSAMSVLYMLCFITAELTAIGAITAMLSDIPGSWTVMAVAIATLLYTAWGGLRASLATDRWQAWLLLALLLLVGGFAALALPPAAFEAALPAAPMGVSLSVALTLVIAVTAANLFHQGYWQRVWAAESHQALRRGAWIGGLATVLVVMAVGGLGILAAMSGQPLGQPPAPFFALLGGAPAWLALPALLLALALVASSVDTLQNGIASLVVTSHQKASLPAARWITVLLMVPVVLVALEGLSVLRLFLIADLLCATAVVPVLLGLWQRMTPRAAMAGCLAGLLGAVLPGWVSSGSLAGGLLAASFPQSIPTLAPFLGALVASSAVSVLLALLTRSATGSDAPKG